MPSTIPYNSVSEDIALKRLVILAALLVGSGSLAVGQAGIEVPVLDKLKRLFPTAATFTPKEGEPLHFTAYASDGRGGRTLLGYAFWTTEVVPLERGYGGPIVMLVGLDPKGVLAGVIVGEHHEPYGSFSIDMPAFPAQFKGKDVRDAFKLGEDVDAVSRATITMSSAVRTIRNASRRVARSLLTPPAAAKP
jgi:transcriptional regulator of nitric oxide reductase